jgi:hypothetical protein
MSLQSRLKSAYQRIPDHVLVFLAGSMLAGTVVCLFLTLKSRRSPSTLGIQSVDTLVVRRLTVQNSKGDAVMFLSAAEDGTGSFIMYGNNSTVFHLSNGGNTPLITMGNSEGKTGLSLSVDDEARGRVFVFNGNDECCAAMMATPEDYGAIFVGKPDGEPLAFV